MVINHTKCTSTEAEENLSKQLKNPMIAPEQRKLLPFGNHPEMLPMLEQQLRMLEENIQRENQVINHMGQITSQRVSSSNTANMVRMLHCMCIYYFL